ncbi:MAG: EAL domain-containing protein, partial [Candidatus Eremiobacteraeota bacterium]|nr:EAL domain-containing protein [Candidatus Eremiobacteraeota bacterium]
EIGRIRTGFVERHVEPVQERRIGELRCGDVERDRQRGFPVLQLLRQARGLSIALDDFGTGFSSLTHLREFPVDVVKIDRSFITTLPEAEESALIAGAVIQLSHRLGSRVQAEGVETEAQRQWLLGEGCDLAQGFLISSPLELSSLHEFLAGAVA